MFKCASLRDKLQTKLPVVSLLLCSFLKLISRVTYLTDKLIEFQYKPKNCYYLNSRHKCANLICCQINIVQLKII